MNVGDLVVFRTDRDRRLGCRKPFQQMCVNAPRTISGLLLECASEEGGVLSWWDVLLAPTCCEDGRIVVGVRLTEAVEILCKPTEPVV